ncbi:MULTISPECIES: DUF4159 domain-containing protein [Halocynthiibacter]|uniref:DUF4159 domain-containing protein n=1 Tax=Halocynthiibacter halioticoli TaxID=2986804 RepID=A0AAE3LUA3_9RHOB|nr:MULTISPECIES: DUF4159 domain-containing protein [Halocynthiibacter]MCV6823395.1 DUF4159 domain-containing protein [Halocynthiibacter halioticoli]MCW4056396.1 DUF4159 domain-containing protein [Halocynthiibacter sp. SDUM655004]
MASLLPISFAYPWLLLGLLALPLLIWLLRAVPPAPVLQRFPAVGLLLGLKDDEAQSDRTPWWLLALRIFALAAVIVGFAGPVLDPKTPPAEGRGDLLVVMDSTWASAAGWSRTRTTLEAELEAASRAGRRVAVLQLTDGTTEAPQFNTAEHWLAAVPSLVPHPYEVGVDRVLERIEGIEGNELDVFWMSDGRNWQGREDVLAALEELGPVRVYETGAPIFALAAAEFQDRAITVPVLRDVTVSAEGLSVAVIGPDPSGVERVLLQTPVEFDGGSMETEVVLELPPEIRNRITRLTLTGQNHAGAVWLSDDALKRREVALFSAQSEQEALAVLDPLHYLRQALVPSTDLIDGAVAETLLANPDVVIFADIARLADEDNAALIEWVEKGGLLVRFAGPRLAASDLSRAEEDPLMPVRLRAGGRTVGGAMSWGQPRELAPFAAESPFFGLEVPDDVAITAQVIAEPDPTLSARVLASLKDGTPLVTRKELGNGHVVLFHVTASARWSTLPLSGLFVQMMERLAISSQGMPLEEQKLEGTVWTPKQVLDGFGQIGLPSAELAGVKGEQLAEAPLSAEVPPGVYTSEDRQIARNVGVDAEQLLPMDWPTRIPVDGVVVERPQPLKGILLAAALVALLADALAALMLSGKLRREVVHGAFAAAAVMLFAAEDARAQEELPPLDPKAYAATREVVMAYVETGDTAVDEVSYAGLYGLGLVLNLRTSIEPAEPIAIDLEEDELAFYPMIYWPITPEQPLPTPAAYAKLNRYMQKGGLILFDTRDADRVSYRGTSENARKLQQLARQLDIPPLEPVPDDHVLRRTFYLLSDLPGRYYGPDVWVEAAPADAERAEGMPFRNLNDGVTPVVIGGNDWAAAWAMTENGNRMFTVGRGRGGERQRELAFRFGVNLMMHVLTGNYKSDQVHVPDLLERLGQ